MFLYHVLFVWCVYVTCSVSCLFRLRVTRVWYIIFYVRLYLSYVKFMHNSYVMCMQFTLFDVFLGRPSRTLLISCSYCRIVVNVFLCHVALLCFIYRMCSSLCWCSLLLFVLIIFRTAFVYIISIINIIVILCVFRYCIWLVYVYMFAVYSFYVYIIMVVFMLFLLYYYGINYYRCYSVYHYIIWYIIMHIVYYNVYMAPTSRMVLPNNTHVIYYCMNM